ncbi:MAG: hypothetical protein LQ344_001588 [Seirophora lacunosa]|nr:MAG: hypothetical protein LQ344_001588 [Seirophora lacunosa]
MRCLRPSLLPSLAHPLRFPLCRTFTTTRPAPLAKICIVGRLAAQPELIPTSSGDDMVRYSLGTSSGPKDNRQTNWWKVAAFLGEGRARDTLMGLGKGSLLYVEGSCTTVKFEDKDGRSRNTVSIAQRQFEILDRRDSSSNPELDGDDSGSQ